MEYLSTLPGASFTFIPFPGNLKGTPVNPVNRLNPIGLKILAFLFCTMVCILTMPVTAQIPDWKWQNSLPTANPINDISMLNAQVGWAAGGSGTILHTDNGGDTWETQAIGLTQSDFLSVQFVNAQTGWAVGEQGVIYKTGDGGLTWIYQASGTVDPLRSVHFIDSQTGWISGKGMIMKTTNGGNTWTTQVTIPDKDFLVIQFVNAQTGWTITDSDFFKTTDGGQTWTTYQGYGGYSFFFLNANLGWRVGSGAQTNKTTDGGLTWTQQVFGGGPLYTVHFPDSLHGFAGGSSGLVLKSNNSGASWGQRPPPFYGIVTAVQFVNDQEGWAVYGAKPLSYYGGAIYKTTNGGTTWVQQTKGFRDGLTSVQFINPQSGWAMATNSNGVLKTTTGGKSWTRLSTGATKNHHAMHFVDASTGWIVGDTGKILKSTDGGLTWQKQHSSTGMFLFSVRFTDVSNGWAVGAYGKMLHTTDGGAHWIAQSIGSSIAMNSIFFADAQNGWIAADSGKVFKTTNGGATWIKKSIPNSAYFMSVSFSDAQHGMLVGYGTICVTKNGGATWSVKSFPGIPLRSGFALDSNHLYAVGFNGEIFRTSNGGATWKQDISGTKLPLSSIHFQDTLTGWAVGTYGAVLATLSNNGTDPSVPSSMITGRLYEKSSASCDSSMNPNPVPHKVVRVMPGHQYALSDNQGRYSFLLDTGHYTAEAINYSSYAFHATTVCPPANQYALHVNSVSDTLSGIDFGYNITPCHFLNVEIAANRRRRCFRNTTTVAYQNQGVLAATDAYILVEFPQWVRPVFSVVPHTVLNDSIWRFDLNTVGPGASGTILIEDSVICGHPEIMDLTQCTKATIYPAPDCPTNPNWNGASLSASGFCQSAGTVLLKLRNSGTGNMTDSSDYRIYLDSVLVSVKRLKLLAGDSILIQVQTGGKTVRLEADQVLFHPTQWMVVATVESCGASNSIVSTGYVNKFTQPQSPNSKTHCLPIRDSYDPNDKQAFPIGFTANHVVKPGTEMEYLVRFQNTGNDTAFTVYVIDSLDNNLNPESFDVGAISHPYEISMQTTKQGRTFLRWQFNHINLPDSTTNELKSHGFIQYRISPKAGIPLGSKARNEAAIYFDFNPPVLTNRTLTTFDNLVFTNPGLTDSVHVVLPTESRKSLTQSGLMVYPNPFTHSLHLKSTGESPTTVSLCDLMGKEIRTLAFTASADLELNALPTGVYSLKFRESGHVLKVVKK